MRALSRRGASNAIFRWYVDTSQPVWLEADLRDDMWYSSYNSLREGKREREKNFVEIGDG